MNIDPEKLIVLFVIAMMVLGPKRLPEAARTVAHWLAEVRKYSTSVRSELRDLLGETADQGVALRDELRKALDEPRKALDEQRDLLAEQRDAIEAGARELRGGGASGAAPALPQDRPVAVSVPDDPTLN